MDFVVWVTHIHVTGHDLSYSDIAWKPAARSKSDSTRIELWHGELPSLDASAMAEHLVEATSARVPGKILHRDELWSQCYVDLMAKTATRLEQEVLRLERKYAHVLDESVDSRHDGATIESSLHGRSPRSSLYTIPTQNAVLSLTAAPDR